MMTMVPKLDRESVDLLVRRLWLSGRTACESVPSDEWRAEGYPEDRTLYRLVDARLALLAAEEEYLSSVGAAR